MCAHTPARGNICGTIKSHHRIARQPPALTRCHVACTQVVLEAMLLKPSMVLPGLDASLAENDQEEVARLTVQTMRRVVPPAVPGIHFLSGLSLIHI